VQTLFLVHYVKLTIITRIAISELTSIPTTTHIIPVQGQRLVRMELPRPSGFSQKRSLWVPEDINEVLAGDAHQLGYPDPSMGCRQRFISGIYVTGSMSGDPDGRKPDFEKLLNVNEVWVMCFRAPRDNQWRLMGRFVGQNSFVGLRLFSRAFLNGEEHYHKQAESFARDWPETESFLSGASIKDYISDPVGDPYVPRL